MGILLRTVLARLKPRLSLIDLQRATEDTFDLCIRDPKVSSMFQALRNSDPAVDHSSSWRDDLHPVLERIASRATRKSQAAECRKIILESMEKRALLWALIEISEAEVQQALINVFFQQLAAQAVTNLVQLVVKQYLYYMLDGLALTLLYAQQFNSTVKIDSFDSHYDAMCKVEAEIMIKKVMLSDTFGLEMPKSSATAKAYREQIVGPLEGPLGNIKREFKENLFLLSPATPDGSQFVAFLNRYSSQLEAFKRESANDSK